MSEIKITSRDQMLEQALTEATHLGYNVEPGTLIRKLIEEAIDARIETMVKVEDFLRGLEVDTSFALPAEEVRK